MRTTLTLDDDLARQLQQESRRSGTSFKELVNRLLRLGLTAAKKPARKPFTVTARKMGLPPGLSYDNVGELLDIIEGPTHR